MAWAPRAVSVVTASSTSGKACVSELLRRGFAPSAIRACVRSESKVEPIREDIGGHQVNFVTGFDAEQPESLQVRGLCFMRGIYPWRVRALGWMGGGGAFTLWFAVCLCLWHTRGAIGLLLELTALHGVESYPSLRARGLCHRHASQGVM